MLGSFSENNVNAVEQKTITKEEIDEALPSPLISIVAQQLLSPATQKWFNESYAAGQKDFSGIQFQSRIDFSNLDISNLDFSNASLQRTIFNLAHVDKFVTAVERRDEGLIRKYLKLNIDVDSVGSNNHTALIHAAIEGNDNIVNLLLEYKADANFHPDNEDSPIILAAQNSHFETVRILAENGANVDSRNNISDLSGRTPLHYAAEKNNIEMIEFLVENSANVNAQDVDGFTPLMIADCYNWEGAIECLLDQGNADLNIEDNKGKTVIDWASENKKTDRVERYRECLSDSEEDQKSAASISSLAAAIGIHGGNPAVQQHSLQNVTAPGIPMTFGMASLPLPKI